MISRYTMHYFLFFLFLSLHLFCGEKEAIRRVQSHLLIQDYHLALHECREALSLYPESEDLKRTYVQALVQSGKNDEAISFWREWGCSNICDNLDLLEMVAWGILTHFEASSQLDVSTVSLMRTSFTNDARAVGLLLKHLHSTNATMRAIAAQLTPSYRDIAIIEALKYLLKEERVWFVRLQVIKALGVMEVREAKEMLTKIMCHPSSTVEEKRASIDSLVTMYEEIDDKELYTLIESKRAELRHLACQVVAHLDLKRQISSIVMLLDDSSPDVRVAALNALHFLGLKNLTRSHLNKIVHLTTDSHHAVSLTSAWIVSRFAPETALQTLRKYIYSIDNHSRYLAAFILGRVGNIDDALVQEVMEIDPYIKANIALGMIGSGVNPNYIADMLYTFLMVKKEKIMWDRSANPLFEIVMPSLICHILPQTLYDSTTLDQFTRLEMCCILALLSHPHAEEAIKEFLTRPMLGLTYNAATTLIEEGGEEAMDIVRNVMQEQNQNVRIQAALVLALSGEGAEANSILQEAYKTTGREMKILILSALGHVGDKSTIPFLASLLEEPYQILKVMAASALIQCLYH